MQIEKQMDFFSIPRLEQISFLIHGFGAKKWEKKEFRRRPEWRNFKLIFLDQIHSNIVQFIDKVSAANLKGDAMLTNYPLVLLLIRTADCLPVLIVDESRKVIAASHCGWKGTSKRLIQRVIQGLEKQYGCEPSMLLVALGPCIGNECYEVGEDVHRRFEEEGLPTRFFQNHPSRKKYLLDLKGANIDQMINLGVKKENIYFIDICTHCHVSLPSFRRDKKKAGRMLSFIGMSF